MTTIVLITGANRGLGKAQNTKLVVVKNDVTLKSDAFDAVKKLKSLGIEHLDIVIANAGVYTFAPLVRDLETDVLQQHLVPNVQGVVTLYQATRSLLLNSAEPKFVTMGLSAGFLTNQPPVPNATYGPTKAAMHWLTKRIDAEEPQNASWILEPGWVQTDMGNAGAAVHGIGKPPSSIAESAAGLEKVISGGKKVTHGGGFWSDNGEQQQW